MIRKFFICAVLVLAYAGGINAQSFTPGVDVITIGRDTTYFNLRSISATPFIVCDDDDLAVVMEVSWSGRDWESMDDAEWWLWMSVWYKNPSLLPDKDLLTPFVKDDALSLFSPNGGNFSMADNGYVADIDRVRTDSDGNVWLGACYTFNHKALGTWLDKGWPVRMAYTQDYLATGIAVPVDLTKECLAIPLTDSVLAILNRINDTQ